MPDRTEPDWETTGLYSQFNFNEFDRDIQARGYFCIEIIDSKRMPAALRRIARDNSFGNEGLDDILVMPANLVLGREFTGNYAMYVPKLVESSKQPSSKESRPADSSTEDPGWPRPRSGGW